MTYPLLERLVGQCVCSAFRANQVNGIRRRVAKTHESRCYHHGGPVQPRNTRYSCGESIPPVISNHARDVESHLRGFRDV